MIYVLGCIALIGAVGLLVSKQPIRSALSLLMSMIALAGIYAILGAHLIFAFQLIIYVGAVMVFLIYIIMLFDIKAADNFRRFSKLSVFAGVCAFAMFYSITTLIGPSLDSSEQMVFTEISTEALSKVLFSKYLVAFELASIILLIGILAISSFFAVSPKRQVKSEGELKVS